MNPDSLRTNEAENTLIRTINSHNIDISCIQETHNVGIDSGNRKLYYILRWM